MALRVPRMATAVAVLSIVAGTAQAQTDRLHLGPRVSYNFDLEKLGVGAQLSVPMVRTLEFYPSFDYFFVDAGSFWNLNADLKWRLAATTIPWLYVGSGLNFARSGGNGAHRSRAGLNLFAGAESRRGRVHPFAEFRFITNDGSSAQLAAGLNFTLARH